MINFKTVLLLKKVHKPLFHSGLRILPDLNAAALFGALLREGTNDEVTSGLYTLLGSLHILLYLAFSSEEMKRSAVMPQIILRLRLKL